MKLRIVLKSLTNVDLIIADEPLESIFNKTRSMGAFVSNMVCVPIDNILFLADGDKLGDSKSITPEGVTRQ